MKTTSQEPVNMGSSWSDKQSPANSVPAIAEHLLARTRSICQRVNDTFGRNQCLVQRTAFPLILAIDESFMQQNGSQMRRRERRKQERVRHAIALEIPRDRLAKQRKRVFQLAEFRSIFFGPGISAWSQSWVSSARDSQVGSLITDLLQGDTGWQIL